MACGGLHRKKSHCCVEENAEMWKICMACNINLESRRDYGSFSAAARCVPALWNKE